MENTDDFPAAATGERQIGDGGGQPSSDRSSELAAIADGLGSLVRSAHMLSLNAAIAASRSGASAPEIGVIAQEIKRVAAELEAFTTRLGKACR